MTPAHRLRRTTPHSVRTTVALLLGTFVVASGCGHKKPRVAEDDYSKAFSELEKNDKDEPSDKVDASVGDGGAPKSPKGPVYPAPFTAEQIREATKNGRTYRYKIEVPGKPIKEYVITFRNVDDSGAELSQGGQASKRMGWLALQQHAEFPKDRVTTRDDKLKTPAGKFECIVYEVAGEEDEIWTYYFAKKLPGAPVFFYVERNGKRLRTTTLIDYLPGT